MHYQQPTSLEATVNDVVCNWRARAVAKRPPAASAASCDNSTWSANDADKLPQRFSTPRPPQRFRRQWQLRARAAAVAPPTNNYPERFAGPAQNLPAVPAQATTRPPKDARRTYLEGAQINHGSGPAPRPARRLRPLRIAAARHGGHRVRVPAANIGTGGSRSRGNLRATPVMVIKADGGRPCSTRSSRRES